MNASAIVSVDPAVMVTVTLAYPGVATGERTVNAILCRYIAVMAEVAGQPQRVIAVEIVHDPINPVPIAPYLFNSAYAERIVLPASSVRLIQPYAPAG
jgi:hypothetical protein